MNFIQQTRSNLKDLKSKQFPAYQVIILALQHMFAMFGATILVPALTGLDPAVALFTSGLGTLVFHVINKGKVPAYLGSSFAFIAPIIAAVSDSGVAGAMVGIIGAGVVYIIIAILIKLIGSGFFKKLLSPVVVGPVIITIGLGLAGVAKDWSTTIPDAASFHLTPEVLANYTESNVFITALITLVVAVSFTIFAKGLFKVIPILLGIIAGYIFAATQGMVNFELIQNAPLFSLPNFTFPDFSNSINAISLITPIALVTMVEHLGDIVALGKTTDKDYVKEPGLHRTLIGDGVATALAGLFGGPPNTTYGENIGVLAITKVYNPLIIQLTALFVLCFSFIGKIGAFIQTIPAPVMGGIAFLLFGLIASIGLRTLKEHDVDLSHNRNLVIISIILMIGISGISVSFWKLTFSGMGLAALVGIILNLIFPAAHDEPGEAVIDEI
ncbi:MAG: uracil-xanthine permease family protein [bacterium]